MSAAAAQSDLVEQLAQAVFERFTRTGVSPAPVQRRLLTIGQAAEYIGRTKRSVEHLIAAKKLRTVRADRTVFLDVRDLDEWIERNKK